MKKLICNLIYKLTGQIYCLGWCDGDKFKGCK